MRLVCSFVKTTWYLTQALELGEQLSELEKAGPVLQVRQSSRISQILQSVSLESWRLWSKHRRSQPADVIVGYLNIIKYLQLGDSCRLIALPGARFAWSRIDGGLLADLHLISLTTKRLGPTRHSISLSPGIVYRDKHSTHFTNRVNQCHLYINCQFWGHSEAAIGEWCSERWGLW